MEDRSFRRFYLPVAELTTFILYIICYILSEWRFEVVLAVSLQSTFSSTKFTRIKFSNSFQLKLKPGKA